MRISLILGLALTSSLAACGADDGTGGGDDAPVNCALETADTYVAGLQKTGVNGMLDFRLMSSDPTPPGRGDNTWIVSVRSMNNGVVGAPISNATAYVTPFMPKHAHPAISGEVTPTANAGEYRMTGVNLWMPGVWETTIEVDATAASSADSVVYTFCLPN
jgi:hypothetical protein